MRTLLFLFGLVPLLAAFRANAQTSRLVEQVMAAADHSNKGLSVSLDVAEGQVARMKAGLEAGPGIARFAFAPKAWWVNFIKAIAPTVGLTVIDNTQLAEYLERTNRLQVRMLELQERRPA